MPGAEEKKKKVSRDGHARAFIHTTYLPIMKITEQTVLGSAGVGIGMTMPSRESSQWTLTQVTLFTEEEKRLE